MIDKLEEKIANDYINKKINISEYIILIKALEDYKEKMANKKVGFFSKNA